MKHINPNLSKLHVVSQLVAPVSESNKNLEGPSNKISAGKVGGTKKNSENTGVPKGGANKIGVDKRGANKIGSRKTSPAQ